MSVSNLKIFYEVNIDLLTLLHTKQNILIFYPEQYYHTKIVDFSLTYFSFQPLLHDWCNKSRSRCYSICEMEHIKEPLLLIGVGSGVFYLFNVSMTELNKKYLFIYLFQDGTKSMMKRLKRLKFHKRCGTTHIYLVQ